VHLFTENGTLPFVENKICTDITEIMFTDITEIMAHYSTKPFGMGYQQ